MPKTLKLRIFLALALITLMQLLYLLITHAKKTNGTNIYEALDALLPIVGGVFGIMTAKKYSGRKSTLGQGIILISLGLITWAIGQAGWTYYNVFQNIDVPYPSFADIGYILAIPLWFLGVIRISSAMGVKYQLRKTSGKMLLIIIPAISIVLSYYLLIVVARGGWPTHEKINLKFITDLAYPFGDAAVASIALTIYVLSRKYIGGRFKLPVLFTLLGFLGMYAADFALSFTTTKETYYSGCWVDTLYTLGLAFIGLGLVLMDPSSKAVAAPPPESPPPAIQPSTKPPGNLS